METKMTDLEFENREKKIIAGSARHKRSGRNSRRCSLPSDLLTDTPVSCETKQIGWEPDTEAPRRRSSQMKKDWWNFCHREQAGEKTEEECKMMSLKNEEPRTAAPEYDPINHPKHYCREGGMECLEEMELVFGANAVRTFCLLNAWKYRYRAADKNGAQDLKKSDWYMRKYRELAPAADPHD